jgi:hypothetical protein
MYVEVFGRCAYPERRGRISPEEKVAEKADRENGKYRDKREDRIGIVRFLR